MIYNHSQLESVQVYDFKHLPQHPHDRDETEDEFKCGYCQLVEVDDGGEICQECQQSLKELN